MVKRDTNLFKVGIPLMTVHELLGITGLPVCALP